MLGTISIPNISTALGGTSVLSQLSLHPGKNTFLAPHLLQRSITHPKQPEMADGLQMRRIFLAGFWQVPCCFSTPRREDGESWISRVTVLSARAMPAPPSKFISSGQLGWGRWGRGFWMIFLPLMKKDLLWQKQWARKESCCLQ